MCCVRQAKYQDIYDSMTEEELAEAQRVHEIRNAGVAGDHPVLCAWL